MFLTLFRFCGFAKPALAAPSKHVLLVYDSLNIAGKKENDVDALQRVLTSFGVEVQSVAVSDYVPGELLNDGYDSLISMVNWPEQAGVIASDFLADRVHFKGKQLHIGRNMRDDEKQYFSGTWKELSHRQYRLEDEKPFFSSIAFSRSISCAGKYARSDGWPIKNTRISTRRISIWCN